MSSRPHPTNRHVIHVTASGEGDRPSDMVTSVSARLVAAGLEIRDIGDVYRALARMGSAGSNSPVAVVVCMDDLTTAEIEFFSIVARIHRGVEVYVYGRSNARERIAGAIDAGAIGEFTDDVIRALAEASSPELTAMDDAASPPPSLQPENTGDPVPGPWTDEPEGPAKSNQQAAEVREPSSDSARFPWRRYEDVPKRKPPSRTATTTPTSLDNDQSKQPDRVHEPLLTDEELRALIGDDPAVSLSDDGASWTETRDADEGQAR